MMTAEERRIDFYGDGDARAYDHDELYIMKEYAKDYHQSEVKKFSLGAVIGSFSLPEIWKMAQKYNCDDFVKMVEEVNRLNDL
jgi:hypothetical protein